MPPTNTCEFKLEMEVKHEAGHYLKVKYNWISVDQTTKAISYTMNDSGYFKDWTLVHIEGEELNMEVSIEEVKAVPDKKGAAKLAAAKKKAEGQKGGKTVGLPEITDNRSRTISFK